VANNITTPENPAVSGLATLGIKYLFYVAKGTYPSIEWVLVGAQRSADMSCEADDIDLSNKVGNGWKNGMAGARGWSVDLGGLMLLQDDGIAIIKQCWRSGKDIYCKFEYPDKTAELGWGYVKSCALNTPHDGAAEFSGTITGNGELAERAPSITPSSATVSKASPSDRVFMIAPSNTAISGVKIDGSSVTISTGYAYSSGTLTIKSATCGALAVGSHTVEATSSDGAVLTVLLTVTA